MGSSTNVVPFRNGAGEPADAAAAGAAALTALDHHLDRVALSAHTVKAYRRQARAYLDWLGEHIAEHPDAFVDQVGAESAIAAWRRQRLGTDRASPATVNQALAAVTLLYAQGPRLHVSAKRARIPRPGAPDALTRPAELALRRAADRRGPRDAAVIATFLGTGARVEEATRLEVPDLAITARTGTARLFGKGDQARTVPIAVPARDRLTAWLTARAERDGVDPHTGALWLGQRGRLSVDGLTKIVLAAGTDAGIPGLRPHRLRHTYATRLRESGADVAQIQYLLGQASVETAARYFRASAEEVAQLVDTALDY